MTTSTISTSGSSVFCSLPDDSPRDDRLRARATSPPDNHSDSSGSNGTLVDSQSTGEPSSAVGVLNVLDQSPSCPKSNWGMFTGVTGCPSLFSSQAGKQAATRESKPPQDKSKRTLSIKTAQGWGLGKVFRSMFGTQAKPAEELEELVSEKTVEQQPEGISGFEVQAVVSQLAIAEMIVLLAAEKEKTAHWKAEAQMSLPAHVIRDLSEFRNGVCSWIGSTVDPIRTRLGMSSMYPAPSAMEDGSEIIDKWLLQKVHQIQMSTANELMSGY
ncbi:hypothetical protein M231_01050 [Tremella mesenterica]|uniref:Uncharacterized protein n=1 Tax=Tremella mesenterica TaxID=5217 RepID=A0A4Q1BTY6_TREME|nr:hypothetical protein M231_01050 [Tremella mesenterica]